MLSNFALNTKLSKTTNNMREVNKVISMDAMQAEWEEIQIAKSNKAMFKPIYLRYYQPIFRFIYKRVADENLAADICSQVFVKAIQKLDNYVFKGVPYSAFLYRVASNEVTTHFRKIQKNRIVSYEDAQLNNIADEMEAVAAIYSVPEMLQALNDLPLEKMQLIEMRYFEKRSFKEIAGILEITESNAKVKTYRILDKLKNQIVKNKKS